jgi:uncharacterized membrane protein YfcA
VTALHLAGLVAIGVFAGTVNTLAGGGSLVTVPLLVLAGLPADVANGTNRIGVLLQSLSAWWWFRGREATSAPLGALEVVPAVIGGTLGAVLAAQLDADQFAGVIGWAMLALIPTLFVRPERWAGGSGVAPAWARALGFLAVGVYGGFLQAGVGLFLVAALVLLSGRDLVGANAGKVALVALFTVPAVAVYAAGGLVAWAPALAVAAGSVVGGNLGARLTVAWGAGAVRWILVAVVVVTSGQLLGWW